MRKLFPLLLILLLLSSCEMEKTNRNIFMISVSLDYKNSTINPLMCTNEDQKAMVEEFAYLAFTMKQGFYAYNLTQDGERVEEWDITQSTIFEKSEQRTRFPLEQFKKRLQEKMHDIAQRATEHDLILFYYAGHGVSAYDKEDEARFTNGALVLGNLTFPSLGDFRTEDANEEVLYPLAALREDLSQLPGQKLLILDSCFSGELVVDDVKNIETKHDFILSFLKPPSVLVDDIWELCGSRFDEESYEESIGGVFHGRFTYTLLEALGYRYNEAYEAVGIPEDKVVTVYSLFETIEHRLNDNVQHPTTSLSMWDLVLYER